MTTSYHNQNNIDADTTNLINYLKRDRDEIITEIRSFSEYIQDLHRNLIELFPPGDIHETFESPDVVRYFLEEIDDSLDGLILDCEQLESLVKQFIVPNTSPEDTDSNSQSRNRDYALRALTTIPVLQAKTTSLRSKFKAIQQKIKQGLTGVQIKVASIGKYIKKQIFPQIKKISAMLLKLIASLVTPNNWSIEGSIGSNMLFFQGTVTLGIEFGK